MLFKTFSRYTKQKHILSKEKTVFTLWINNESGEQDMGNIIHPKQTLCNFMHGYLSISMYIHVISQQKPLFLPSIKTGYKVLHSVVKQKNKTNIAHTFS